MSTPVIIPARQEEKYISGTLEALARQDQAVEPVVVINGGSDRTADIARMTGATVLESEEGKVRAIQAGLRFLGHRALDNLLILDADTKPISKKWSRRFNRELADLPQEAPAIVWGPYIFHGDVLAPAGIFFSATSMYVSWADRDKAKPRTIRGGNTGLKIKNTELLEEMLQMDNYWPREDVAIYDTAMSQGANKKVLLHPEAWAETSGFRLNNALKQIVRERRHPNEIYDDSYAAEAPPGSRPYYSEN